MLSVLLVYGFAKLVRGVGASNRRGFGQGKFGVASNRTSIPEVGGNLINYLDKARRSSTA